MVKLYNTFAHEYIFDRCTYRGLNYLLRLLASQDTASRTSDLQDGLSWVAVTASLRDIWISLMIWSAQRSGGRPLGRRHDEGGVDTRMSIACVPGCRRHI